MHQDKYQAPSETADLSRLARTTPRSMIRDEFDKAARTPGVISLAHCSCERCYRFWHRALVVPTIGNDPALAFFPERP